MMVINIRWERYTGGVFLCQENYMLLHIYFMQ